MASVLKARRIANPGRKRRKLSAKQIRYFGTKRQRAALKRRKNPTSWAKKLGLWTKAQKRAGAKLQAKERETHKVSVQQRQRQRNASRLKRKRVKNVGAVYTVTLGGNPGKKESKTMARRKRAHRRIGAHRRRRAVSRRRRNPPYIRRVRRGRYLYGNPHRRRRRNPSRRHRVMNRRRRNPGFGVGSVSGMAKKALYIIGGAIGTRALTQLVLRDKNTGAMGYVANAVASFVLGYATKKVMKSEEAGNMVTIGGMTGLVLRLLQDVTPIGKYVNLQLSGMGMLGDAGMGAIVPTTFFVPLYHAAGGENIANTQLPAAVRAAMAPAATAGMRGVGTITRGGRYTGTGRYSS